MASDITIREAQRGADGAGVWSILAPILAAGDTYDLPRDWTEGEALDFWFAPNRTVFVAVDRDGAVAGTFFLAANGLGGGRHIANAGFAVAAGRQGRGIGARLGETALAEARARGFAAMQFNHVVSVNARAVALWERLGFRIVGRVPQGFRLPTSEVADQLIMYREL